VPKLLEPESRGAQPMVKPNPTFKETTMTAAATRTEAAYEIRFQSLFKEGRALSFPCDQEGRFDLDNAHPRLRDSYLFARAMMGREYAYPVVLARQLH